MIRRPKASLEGRIQWAGRAASIGLILVQLCGGTMMTEKALGAELEVQVLDQKDDGISLEYALRNRSGGRILAFDQMLYFDAKGTIQHAETGAHVFLEGEETARIVRGFIAPPLYMSVARRPPIVASVVEPGGASTGVIALPLPLREANPYFPPQPCDPKSRREISRLRVQIGWVEARAGMKIGSFKLGDLELTRLSGGWGTPLQRLAETEVAVRGVELCLYPGRFDRPQLQQ